MCFKRRKKQSNRGSPRASTSTKDADQSLPGGSSRRTSKGSEGKQSLKSSESENDSKKKRTADKDINRSTESLKSSERENDSKKRKSGDEDNNRLKSSEREDDSKKRRPGDEDINRTRDRLKSSEREDDSKKRRPGNKDTNHSRESLKSSESENDSKKKRSDDEDINRSGESLKSSEREDDSKKKRSGDKDINRSRPSSNVMYAKEKDSRKAGKKSSDQEDNYKVCWYRDSKGSVWKTVCRTCDKAVQADAKKCTYPCSDEGPNNQSAVSTNTNDRRQSSGNIRSVGSYDRRRSSGNIRSVGTYDSRRSIGNIRSVGTYDSRRYLGSSSSVSRDGGTYCWSRNTGSKFWSSICPTCDANPPRGDCTYPCSSGPRQILPSAPQYSQMSISRGQRPTTTEEALKCYIPACPAADDSTVTASDSTGQSRPYKAKSRMTTQVQQYSDSEDDSRSEGMRNEKDVRKQESWRDSSQDSTNMRSVRNSFTMGEGQFPPDGKKCPNPCSGDKRFLQPSASTNTNRYNTSRYMMNNRSFGRGQSSGNIRSVERTGSEFCWYRDSHSGYWKTICSICDNDHQRAECYNPCSCNSHQIPP